MTENIAKLAGAYSKTPMNELEKRLQEQAKPGFLPTGSMRLYALNAALKALAITDPERYQRIRSAQINGEDIDISAILRGEA